MLDTVSSNQCEKCHAARVVLFEKADPVKRLHVVLAVVAAVVLAYVAKVFVAQGSTWALTGSETLGYVTLAIGWVLLGVTALGALIGTVGYVVINGWGMSVIYAIDRAGDFHVHEYSWDFGSERSMVDFVLVVRGRIGGWLRSTVIMKGGATWQKARTWDGMHMTVVDPTGDVTLSITDAVRFFSATVPIATATERYSALRHVAHEMTVIEKVAEHPDSPFGQSKHGVFACNRAKDALSWLDDQFRLELQMGSGEAAHHIVNDARRKENRSA